MLGGLQSAKIETACHIFHVPSTFKPVAHTTYEGGTCIKTALHEVGFKIQKLIWQLIKSISQMCINTVGIINMETKKIWVKQKKNCNHKFNQFTVWFTVS